MHLFNLKAMQARMGRLTRNLMYGLILLPVVAAAVAYTIWHAVPQSTATMDHTAAVADQTATAVISAQTLAERFGLEITRIAVTAGGGIIDVRYRVLDKEKAGHVLDDPDNGLYLIVEESGVTLTQPGHAMKHNSELKNNMSYYTFYPNTQNVIQPGTPVAVAFGSVRVEPMAAQ